jgi:hypothetical protein
VSHVNPVLSPYIRSEFESGLRDNLPPAQLPRTARASAQTPPSEYGIVTVCVTAMRVEGDLPGVAARLDHSAPDHVLSANPRASATFPSKRVVGMTFQ